MRFSNFRFTKNVSIPTRGKGNHFRDLLTIFTSLEFAAPEVEIIALTCSKERHYRHKHQQSEMLCSSSFRRYHHATEFMRPSSSLIKHKKPIRISEILQLNFVASNFKFACL